MSRPEHIERAGSKPEQLVRAARMGFETPKTVITNDADAAHAFVDDCGGRAIYKALIDSTLGLREPGDTPSNEELSQPGGSLYSTLITRETLEALIDGVRYAPCLMQEYVEKAYELRITIIRDDVFTARINSQAQERTRIDWRHLDVPMQIEETTIPDWLREKCLQFVRSYHLEFSALDFIYTPDGRYVFLENNPSGQWLSVENRVPTLKLVNSFISAMTAGPRDSHKF